MDLLEQSGRLNRRLEGLPDKRALTERLALGRGLNREVAVLLAYSKMSYFESIVASDIPDDPFVLDRLIAYFSRGWASAMRTRSLDTVCGARSSPR